MVEFVIVFPLLMLILVGLFDLGRVFFAAITIANAAREGARYASLYPADKTGIKIAALDEAFNSGIVLSVDDVTITCQVTCKPEEWVKVTVTNNVELILGWVLPSPVTISRYVVMEIP